VFRGALLDVLGGLGAGGSAVAMPFSFRSCAAKDGSPGLSIDFCCV
jgi:hypothetical protein